MITSIIVSRKEIKRLVWRRDKYICQFCKRRVFEKKHEKGVRTPSNTATVDHIIPESAGGLFTLDNLRTCCYRCNQLFMNKFHTSEQRVEYLKWEKHQRKREFRRSDRL